MTLSDLQKQLKAAGYYQGAIDGQWGPLSQAALDSQVRDRGQKVPPWLIAAERELGISEISGPVHSGRILQYHSCTSLEANTDEIPWCSSFVNAMMQWTDWPSTKSAAARSWLKYGIECPLSSIPYGAIVVLTRGSNSAEGHVGFKLWNDDHHIILLGGNQSNKVCAAVFPFDKVIGARWPKI